MQLQACRIFWFFGLPSSGKTTLAKALRSHILATEGQQPVLLDGDDFRSGLCSDLGFSDADRAENIRRAAELANLLANQGFIVICAFITPKEYQRGLVRKILGDRGQLIFVNCALETCVKRDVKGLYQQAAAQKLTGMTGTQDPFAVPDDFDIHLDTDAFDLESCLRTIVDSSAASPFRQKRNLPS